MSFTFTGSSSTTRTRSLAAGPASAIGALPLGVTQPGGEEGDSASGAGGVGGGASAGAAAGLARCSGVLPPAALPLEAIGKGIQSPLSDGRGSRGLGSSPASSSWDCAQRACTLSGGGSAEGCWFMVQWDHHPCIHGIHGFSNIARSELALREAEGMGNGFGSRTQRRQG